MQSVQAFFDKIAPTWDAGVDPNDFRVAQIVLQELKVDSTDIVLDVGAGTGLLTPYLEKIGGPFEAIDISQGMVTAFRAKYPNAPIRCGDYEDASLFAPASLSKIIVFNAFPHFARPERVFANAWTHLKPGGSFAIAHSMRREALNLHHSKVGGVVGNHMLISDKELRVGMLAAGFDTVEIRETDYFLAVARKRGPS